MIVGTGEHRYKAVPNWGAERTLGIASGVATDSQDRVYVVDREPNPAIVVFDRAGHTITTWGQDILTLPHEIWIDAEDRVYIADCGNHSLRIFNGDGDLLQTIGTPNEEGPDGQPFNQPTRVVRHPSGELMVSDGYGQCYLHRLSADGELLQTWGGPGSGPGQYTLPHNIFAAPDGRLLAVDREPNNRIQVLEPEGTFVEEWKGRPTPCGIFIDTEGIVYLAEGGGVSVLTLEGRLLTQWVVRGGPSDRPHGTHGIWVDRHGDIYVGEVGVENLIHKFQRV